jgi:hypothetical protein
VDAPLPFTAHIAHIDYTLRAVTGQGSEQVTHRLYSQSPCIHTARKIKMAAPLYYMPKTTSREGLPELESHHIPYHLMAIWTVSVLVLVFALRLAVLKITDMTDPKGPQRRVRKPGEKPGRWEDRGLERVWFWYYVLHIVCPSPYSVWEYGVWPCWAGGAVRPWQSVRFRLGKTCRAGLRMSPCCETISPLDRYPPGSCSTSLRYSAAHQAD